MNELRLYYPNEAWKVRVLNSIEHIVHAEFPESTVVVSEEQKANTKNFNFVTISFPEMSTEEGRKVCALIEREFPNTVDYFPNNLTINRKKRK